MCTLHYWNSCKKPDPNYKNSDKLYDLSTKLYKAPEHSVLENPLATVQTAMVQRAHHVTLDTKRYMVI